jgi:hypothetical protein
MFQGLLFDDDNEASAQELARRTALEKAHVEAEARKSAWDAGKPFLEDTAKWAAAHRDLINAGCREKYRESYPESADYFLYSAARYRAEKLGCKIGRRVPMRKIYRRATTEELVLCYWCKYLTKRGERHVDHIQALSTGGEHVAGNLCITCIDCNLSKGDDAPEVFRKRIAAKRSFNQAMVKEYFLRRASA